mgnify:CR=1 FL=1
MDDGIKGDPISKMNVPEKIKLIAKICASDKHKDPIKDIRRVCDEAAGRDIRCENCSRLFDVMKAEVGDRTLENTLTGLKDLNNPWVKVD